MALVPSAIPREEGCRDTARVPTPHFPSLLSHPKPPRNSLHVPSLQPPPSREEKKRKLQSESKPGKHLFGRSARDGAGHPRDHPLAAVPKPGTAAAAKGK